MTVYKKTLPKQSKIGGCDKDRTCDPYDVNVVLIPLSYTPNIGIYAFYIICFYLARILL